MGGSEEVTGLLPDSGKVYTAAPSQKRSSSEWRFYITVIAGFFAQGIVGSLPALAVSYYYKDNLKLNPDITAAVGSINTIPWTIKPIYGFLSDNFPILGYRRKFYLIISSAIVAISYAAMAMLPVGIVGFTLIRFLATLFLAISIVVVEALTVEKSQGLSQSKAAEYQSLCWGTRAFASCLGSFFGGYLLKFVSNHAIFGMVAGFMVLVTFASGFAPDVPINRAVAAPLTLKAYFSILKKAMSRPVIWKPALLVLFIFATPSNPAGFYFLTNDLHMSSAVLGTVNLLGSISSVIGISMYQAFLKDKDLKFTLIWTTVVSSLLGCTSVILYTHANRIIHIPDVIFLGTDSVVVSAISELSWMPVMTLGARLCPPGVEASVFSLLTSLMNLGSFFSGELGALMTKLLHVTNHDFKWLWLLSLLCNLSSILPLVFISWLPPSNMQNLHEEQGGYGAVGGGGGASVQPARSKGYYDDDED